MSAVTFILQAWGVIPELFDAGIDIMEFWEKANDAIESMQEEKRDPTAEEWDALNDMIEDLRAQRPELINE